MPPASPATDPSTPHVGLPPSWAVVILTVCVMGLALPADFFWTYAFNDQVGWADHCAFLVRAAAAVLVLAAVLAGFVRSSSRVPLPHAESGSLLVTSAVVLTAGAAYAALSVLPAMDAAVGQSASDGDCAFATVILLAVSTWAFRAGRTLLEPSRT